MTEVILRTDREGEEDLWEHNEGGPVVELVTGRVLGEILKRLAVTLS
jgi:hypothetical protein